MVTVQWPTHPPSSCGSFQKSWTEKLQELQITHSNEWLHQILTSTVHYYTAGQRKISIFVSRWGNQMMILAYWVKFNFSTSFFVVLERGLLFHLLSIKQKLNDLARKLKPCWEETHLRSSPGCSTINVRDIRVTVTSFHNHLNVPEFNLWVGHKTVSPSSQLFPLLKPSLLGEKDNTKSCFHLWELPSFELTKFSPEDREFFFIVFAVLVC